MIKYVKLSNYLSLKELYVNFMKTETKVKNFVLIYGENGSGKSNFAGSFRTLVESIRTMSSLELYKKLVTDVPTVLDNYLLNNTDGIIKKYKTIGSHENMILEYGFICNGKNGIYRIEYDNEKIVSERLDYVLSKNKVNFFNITEKETKINSRLFSNKKYLKEFEDLIDRYWGEHSFMAILFNETIDENADCLSDQVSSKLLDVLVYLSSIYSAEGISQSPFNIIDSSISERLDKGIISVSEEEKLNKIENVLNEFFTSIYSDIKKVYYKKEYKNGNISYELYVKKLIYGEIVDIEFMKESSGTKHILSLISYLILAILGKTVVIDEFDTGIHDLLVYNILENVFKYIKGQLIITTHNTMLIESEIPKENIYVFNVNRNAEKELIAITDFDGRIHQNINPRKKYLKGMYGGVPIATDIDFEELIDILK